MANFKAVESSRVIFCWQRLNHVQSSQAMYLGERLKSLRQSIGLSQEAVGAQGFVSTPGWIKIENGQRQASEKLIEKLVNWLVADKHLRSSGAGALRDELLTLKYLGNRSPFVRELAKAHAKKMPDGGVTLLTETPRSLKPKRGRPPLASRAGGVALAAESPRPYQVKRRASPAVRG